MSKIKIYKVFIRSAFDGFEKYYFIGDKEQLMTLIGVLHSTRIVKIEYVGYETVKKIPDDCQQIKYGIRANGDVFTYIEETDNDN